MAAAIGPVAPFFAGIAVQHDPVSEHQEAFADFDDEAFALPALGAVEIFQSRWRQSLGWCEVCVGQVLFEEALRLGEFSVPVDAVTMAVLVQGVEQRDDVPLRSLSVS